MALSTGLIRRLESSSSEEPLSKRLKLAENALYSPDLPIVSKENLIFRWLSSELSEKNTHDVWMTIQRCLALEPKNFSKLSPEIRNSFIEKLIIAFNGYPEVEVYKEMLLCCSHIFSSSNILSSSKENEIMRLVEALITFTSNVTNSGSSEENIHFEKIALAVECTENVTSLLAQNCRHSNFEKTNLITTFIEKILFPLTVLVKSTDDRKISSRLRIETQKCIKVILLGSIKNYSSSTDSNDEKNKEAEDLFNSLRIKTSVTRLQDVTVAFTSLFQCVVNNFQQDSALVVTILRKLVGCIEHKEKSKHVLISLLENSFDVSYNFDHEIDGISLKKFLEQQIKDIMSKKKCLKSSDYNLLSAISKLNPLIVEEITQSLLERIFFEEKPSDCEKVSYEILIKELWKSSVRLRRQHKFLSKLLLSIRNCEEKRINETSTIDRFYLPDIFLAQYKEDLKSRTMSTQVLAIFHTLIYHLKSDCVGKFEISGPSVQITLMSRFVSVLAVTLFENANFLDSSLTTDWHIKFYQATTDLGTTLASFSKSICESDRFETIIFLSFVNLVKIWCEVYDLLRYYLPSFATEPLNFPVDESHLKGLKKFTKKCENKDCEDSLNQLYFFKSTIFNRDNQEPFKDKIITHLWAVILENHFETIQCIEKLQLLKLSSYLVKEACSSEDNLIKWTSFFKQNISRVTKLFSTAVALQAVANIVEDIETCSTKKIIVRTEFEKVLESLDDLEKSKAALESAEKEIAKQEFKTLGNIDYEKVKRNLIFLSSLPISFLDTHVRTFLFMVLYTFGEETKTVAALEEHLKNLYLDCLRQNDIDILNKIPSPSSLINHFKGYETILLKICKLSLGNLSATTFWEEFMFQEEYNKKINSILLIAVDSSKSKASSNDHKSFLHNLCLKLCKKMVKSLQGELDDPDEIAGLRICLKIILLENKKMKDNLKNCVESTLGTFVQKTVGTGDTKLIREILLLFLMTLSNREKFDLTEEITNKLCILLIDNPDEKILSHYFQILNDKEFEFYIKSLSKRTEESLSNGDLNLESLIVIWENISKFKIKATRSKVLYNHVNFLFNNLLISEVNDDSTISLLRLCRIILTSKSIMRLSERMIDSIFVISTECFNKLNESNKLITCQEGIALSVDFLRSKADLVLDRLPALTNLFRKVVSIIVQEAKVIDASNEQILRILAVDIEKFCAFFAKLKKDVTRISPYLIADLIDFSSRAGVLPNFVKISIDSSISHLLSNCDRYAISFLSRTLPTSIQQVFKSYYDNYTKYHKFTGKI